jgi:hypothetical protein
MCTELQGGGQTNSVNIVPESSVLHDGPMMKRLATKYNAMGGGACGLLFIGAEIIVVKSQQDTFSPLNDHYIISI